ncbi:glutamine amidotransferase [Sphaerisporangium melleum]|uniref:Glutamine amidotransferase n=1 Tax=Sphaerisporangium melleum TaxID=321316 RepID=A0A917R3N5_9ACTN|nr:type 1 glutamine amidotransferase [Sphaerisporangium melleum]GGK88440.1 glutamine amidotransferase [Sphaerisporangium melleum]GII67681.1 glutamine amidotransferase [Sphaerisporangium melleum]
MTHRILIVEHEAEAGLGYFAGWLAEAGMTCHVVRPYLGEPLPSLDGGTAPAGPWDGLIVLGGAPSAWDDEGTPWLPGTRALLRRAVETSLPTLGICLGAQLMALACGGRVEPGTAGPEVGLGAISLLPAAAGDPLFAALPLTARAVQYHQDAVTVPPPGAVLLATAADYPTQAYRLGERAWGVQFHPEASVEIFLSWTAPNADRLAEDGLDAARLDAEVVAAGEELRATWRPLAEAFAAVVRGAAGPGTGGTEAGGIVAGSGTHVH